MEPSTALMSGSCLAFTSSIHFEWKLIMKCERNRIIWLWQKLKYATIQNVSILSSNRIKFVSKYSAAEAYTRHALFSAIELDAMRTKFAAMQKKCKPFCYYYWVSCGGLCVYKSQTCFNRLNSNLFPLIQLAWNIIMRNVCRCKWKCATQWK